MNAHTSWNDQKIEHIIGNLLRAGVMLAAAVVLAGGILYLLRHGGAQPDYRSFRGEPMQLRSITGISKSAATLHSKGIVQLGLLLLVLTPIARVLFSAVAFALEGDRVYVAVTLIVLAVLMFSLAGTIQL